MAIDASIYQNAASEPANPLKTLADAQAVSNAMQQNRLLQTQNEQAKVGLDMSKIENGIKHYDAVQKIFSSLVNDPQLSQKKMLDTGINMIANGMITPQQLNQEMQNWGEDTPKNNMKVVENHLFNAQSMADQLKQVYGDQKQFQAGGRIVSGTQLPASQGGAFIEGGATPISTTPSEKMQQTPAIINGVEGTVPQGNKFDEYGNIRGGSAEVVPKNPVSDGIKFSTVDDVVVPGEAAQTPKVSSSPAFTQTKRTPLQEAEQVNTGNQSIALQNSADSSPDRKAILSTMEGLIKSGDFNSGPGAQQWKDISAGVQRVFGIESGSVASQEEFQKLSERLLQEQFKTIGGTGTDAKFNSAYQSSPSTVLSNLGNQGIIALMKGNEDAIRIKNQEWRSYKDATEAKGMAPNYADFSKKFNEKFDPRVFQSIYMEPDQRKKMIAGLNKDEREKFRSDFDAAGAKGWLGKMDR